MLAPENRALGEVKRELGFTFILLVSIPRLAAHI